METKAAPSCDQYRIDAEQFVTGGEPGNISSASSLRTDIACTIHYRSVLRNLQDWTNLPGFPHAPPLISTSGSRATLLLTASLRLQGIRVNPALVGLAPGWIRGYGGRDDIALVDGENWCDNTWWTERDASARTRMFSINRWEHWILVIAALSGTGNFAFAQRGAIVAPQPNATQQAIRSIFGPTPNFGGRGISVGTNNVAFGNRCGPIHNNLGLGGFGHCHPFYGRCYNPYPCYGFQNYNYFSTAVVGPVYPAYSVGYGGVDPYVYQLQDQNFRLQQNLAALQARDRDRENNVKPVRVDVELRRREAIEEAAQIRQQEKAKQYAAAGTRLFNTGSYRRAAERLREALLYNKNEATHHFLLAQALFASRDFPEAAQAVRNGLKLNPDWLELDFDVRALYKDADEILPQLAALAGQLQANPLDRDALFLLGYQLFVTDQKEKARVLLEQSARLERDDTPLKPFFDYFAKQEKAVAQQLH